MKTLVQALGVWLSLFFAQTAWAVDSYRYLHVTIETPWHIFLFLLVIVLFPFVLMAILYWHFALRKPVAAKAMDETTTPEGR